MDIVFYEDDGAQGLYPVALTRPVFDIRTAGVTLSEAARVVFPSAKQSAFVRGSVAGISPLPAYIPTAIPALFIDARLAPSITALKAVAREIQKPNADIALRVEGVVVGFFTRTPENITTYEKILERAEAVPSFEIAWKRFSVLEEVIFFNHAALADNLQALGKALRSRRGVYMGKGVTIAKTAVLDASKGPIVLADHAEIKDFSVLRGPLFVGEGSVIKEFAVVEGSSIGPVCRVGGEVVGTVIDGYSNKQHTGDLGMSYVGRWVNIGGGTNVSDLKNTYSNVSVMGRDSGAQFLGAIMGDFVKTAINSSIFPGKVLGPSAHIYGLAAEDVPAFTSLVRPGVMYELPLSIAERGQEAMAMRRGVHFDEASRQQMAAVFAASEVDREKKNVSKGKITFN